MLKTISNAFENCPSIRHALQKEEWVGSLYHTYKFSSRGHDWNGLAVRYLLDVHLQWEVGRGVGTKFWMFPFHWTWGCHAWRGLWRGTQITGPTSAFFPPHHVQSLNNWKGLGPLYPKWIALSSLWWIAQKTHVKPTFVVRSKTFSFTEIDVHVATNQSVKMQMLLQLRFLQLHFSPVKNVSNVCTETMSLVGSRSSIEAIKALEIFYKIHIDSSCKKIKIKISKDVIQFLWNAWRFQCNCKIQSPAQPKLGSATEIFACSTWAFNAACVHLPNLLDEYYATIFHFPSIA